MLRVVHRPPPADTESKSEVTRGVLLLPWSQFHESPEESSSCLSEERETPHRRGLQEERETPPPPPGALAEEVGGEGDPLGPWPSCLMPDIPDMPESRARSLGAVGQEEFPSPPAWSPESGSCVPSD